VSTQRNERRQRTLATCPRAGVGRAMPEDRRRAFSRASSASGVGGMRPHRQAPGAGIPAGASTVGGSVAGSVDAMLHGTGGDAMTHDGRGTGGHQGGASNQRVAGLTTGNRSATTRGAEQRGIGGKRGLTGGPRRSATVMREMAMGRLRM
jgi:hypothetical protein